MARIPRGVAVLSTALRLAVRRPTLVSLLRRPPLLPKSPPHPRKCAFVSESDSSNDLTGLLQQFPSSATSLLLQTLSRLSRLSRPSEYEAQRLLLLRHPYRLRRHIPHAPGTTRPRSRCRDIVYRHPIQYVLAIIRGRMAFSLYPLQLSAL